MCRFIAMLSEIPMIKFRTKEIADNERDSRKFVRAANILNTFDGKLIIDNDSSCISEIVKNVREFKTGLSSYWLLAIITEWRRTETRKLRTKVIKCN